MRWEVSKDGFVALKEVARRMNRVMESVKLACRQKGIAWAHADFKGREMNAIKVSDLPSILEQLSNMTRRKSRKGIKLRRRAKVIAGRVAQEKVYGSPVWPEKPAETEEEQVPTSAPAMKPSVSYSNGLAPSSQWDAFVKAAENTVRLARQVKVQWFEFQDSGDMANPSFHFERTVNDKIVIQ